MSKEFLHSARHGQYNKKVLRELKKGFVFPTETDLHLLPSEISFVAANIALPELITLIINLCMSFLIYVLG